MDESKNESKTIVIVPIKIANISEYFPYVSYFTFTPRKEERERRKRVAP